MGSEVAETVLQLIENANNVEWITKYYKWELIKKGKDDNKFIDCAIASNAVYLVSNDKHFKVLKDISFPKIKVISASYFKDIINKS